MQIIIRKAIIVAPPTPPPPPFVGTRIRIRLDDPASLTWGIFSLTLAEGHTKAVIDWGDGITVETAETQVTHTYAQPGEYEVSISDDIAVLAPSTKSSTSPFRLVYAPMIREFHTNASVLEKLGVQAFYTAQNLKIVRCEDTGLHRIEARSFGGCSQMVGRFDFPSVDSLNYLAFTQSPGITELHFSEANEETIKALPAWEQSGHKFGAENATVFFDL